MEIFTYSEVLGNLIVKDPRVEGDPNFVKFIVKCLPGCSDGGGLSVLEGFT